MRPTHHSTDAIKAAQLTFHLGLVQDRHSVLSILCENLNRLGEISGSTTWRIPRFPKTAPGPCQLPSIINQIKPGPDLLDASIYASKITLF